MIVCMSRRICIDLYRELTRLRPDWHHDDDDGGRIKVVMTGSASDSPDWQPHIATSRAARCWPNGSAIPAIPFRSYSCGTCG